MTTIAMETIALSHLTSTQPYQRDTSSATAQGNASGSSWKHTSYAKHPRERRRLSRWLMVWVFGMSEVELDGRRGRSFRLSSDGTMQTTEPNNGSAIPAGT